MDHWMLVLASSRKLGGRCVAGIDARNVWVRPVSDEEHGTLHASDCGGRFPDVLDVVRFRSVQEVPTVAHPEDVSFTPGSWEQKGRKEPRKVLKRLARRCAPGPNLLTGSDSSVGVRQVERRGVYASLALVEPPEVTFACRDGKVRVQFPLKDSAYDLPLTDFEVEPSASQLEGDFDYEGLGFPQPRRLFLTVSLSEPYRGRHYKLVAAVLPVPA